MSNYEIMILTKLESSEDKLKEIILTSLKLKDAKLVKLERNELAYPIKKQTRANYYLLNVKADNSLIAELVRKLNINKSVLRYLIINLDTEKNMKPKKFQKFHKFNNRNQNSNRAHFDNKEHAANDGVKKPFVKKENGEAKTNVEAGEKKIVKRVVKKEEKVETKKTTVKKDK